MSRTLLWLVLRLDFPALDLQEHDFLYVLLA